MALIYRHVSCTMLCNALSKDERVANRRFYIPNTVPSVEKGVFFVVQVSWASRSPLIVIERVPEASPLLIISGSSLIPIVIDHMEIGKCVFIVVSVFARVVRRLRYCCLVQPSPVWPVQAVRLRVKGPLTVFSCYPCPSVGLVPLSPSQAEGLAVISSMVLTPYTSFSQPEQPTYNPIETCFQLVHPDVNQGKPYYESPRFSVNGSMTVR